MLTCYLVVFHPCGTILIQIPKQQHILNNGNTLKSSQNDGMIYYDVIKSLWCHMDCITVLFYTTSSGDPPPFQTQR